jgi:hypothetical protein
MPDGSGNIKGISTSGIQNKWLDEIEERKRLDRDLEDKLAEIKRQPPLSREERKRRLERILDVGPDPTYDPVLDSPRF